MIGGDNDGPPLFYAASPGVPNRVPCAFCGTEDLRVRGPRRQTYLFCPKCRATGPVGNGLAEAVRRYEDWPGHNATPAADAAPEMMTPGELIAEVKLLRRAVARRGGYPKTENRQEEST